MRRTVRGLLDRKGHEVLTVRPSSTVYDALQVMADHNIGAVVVTQDDRLVGIFTERDYARKIILMQRSSMDTQVSDIMTPVVHTVVAENDLDHCMEMMTNGRFRHLPVMEDDVLIGIVSIGDVVKAIIESQQSMIGDLERLISG